MNVKSLSRVRLLATSWTAARQAPLSMGFSRQEHWSGCHRLLRGRGQWSRKGLAWGETSGAGKEAEQHVPRRHNARAPTCKAGDRRREFSPWVGRVPGRRNWQPTPVFLPGELRGQRSLEGYSPWGREELDRLCDRAHARTHTHTHTHTSETEL